MENNLLYKFSLVIIYASLRFGYSSWRVQTLLVLYGTTPWLRWAVAICIIVHRRGVITVRFLLLLTAWIIILALRLWKIRLPWSLLFHRTAIRFVLLGFLINTERVLNLLKCIFEKVGEFVACWFLLFLLFDCLLLLLLLLWFWLLNTELLLLLLLLLRSLHLTWGW